MRKGYRVHAILCDDIRFEHDGKASLIGMYLSQITVNGTVPAGLPQLWLALWIEFPASTVPDAIKVVAKGDTLESQPFELIIDPKEMIEENQSLDDQIMKGNFIFNRWAPAIFKNDGTITIDVFADDKKIYDSRYSVVFSGISNPNIPPAITI